MWQGFNASVLSISYKLPAQNLNSSSSIGMLRIAEYFKQPSDSLSYSKLFPRLATKNSMLLWKLPGLVYGMRTCFYITLKNLCIGQKYELAKLEEQETII